MDLDRSCVEALKLHIVALAAVHRVESLGLEALCIEEVHAKACLLVRREKDLDISVHDLGMFHQIRDCGHDFRNTALVITAKKSIALRSDDL